MDVTSNDAPSASPSVVANGTSVRRVGPHHAGVVTRNGHAPLPVSSGDSNLHDRNIPERNCSGKMSPVYTLATAWKADLAIAIAKAKQDGFISMHQDIGF